MPTITDALKDIIGLSPNNTALSKYYQFILEKGKYYDKEDESTTRLTDNLEVLQKACFRNSLLGALVKEYEYVQGFYFTENFIGLPLEHAWNVNRENGLAVDLTATKYKIGVVSRFGVKVPKKVLYDYLNTPQHLTALEYYYIYHINKSKN